MPSTQILSAQSAQVIANLTAITAGHTTDILGVILVPRLGAAQPIRVRALIDAIEIELEVILYDQVFDDYGAFGEMVKGKKTKGVSF